MANFAQGVSAASSFVDILAQIMASRQQIAQHKGAAAANDYNAAVNRQRAEVSQAIYGQREDQARRMSRMELGRKSAQGAQNALGLGGSVGDLERQSRVAAELDALNIRYEGTLDAHGYEQEARLEGWNASRNRRSARGARTSGFIGVGGSMLSGAGAYHRAGQLKIE